MSFQNDGPGHQGSEAEGRDSDEFEVVCPSKNPGKGMGNEVGMYIWWRGCYSSCKIVFVSIEMIRDCDRGIKRKVLKENWVSSNLHNRIEL